MRMVGAVYPSMAVAATLAGLYNGRRERGSMVLRDKVVWITGASSGIGEALALALAERGARLVLSARRADRLEDVRRRCGAGRARVLPLDIADASSFPEAVSRAQALFGRIDVLVNNAGVSQRSLFLETSPETIRRLAETDFLGPVLLTRAVLPAMATQGAGHVVLVSSLTGKVGVPLRTIYSAAKHALHGFAEALRAEVWRHGIGVTVVAPGFVRTDISASALEGNGGAHGVVDPGVAAGIGADACARAIVRGLERERLEVLVGLGPRGRLAVILKALAPGILARWGRTARVT
jgi:dehydrogenase/reductase SDR family protein 7B